MPTPFSYPENVNSIIDLVNHVNTITDGFFGVSVLLAVGVIAFLSTKHYTFETSLGFSAFFVMIVALFLRFMELITYPVFYFCIVIFVGAAIFLFIKRESRE